MYIKNILREDEKILLVIKYSRIIYLKLFFTFKFRDFMEQWFHEMACTNKQIISKIGIFDVQTREILLRQIETVSIEQDFWGRVFGYGKLQFTGTGNSLMTLTWVRNVQDIKRKIDEILSNEHGPMHETFSPKS